MPECRITTSFSGWVVESAAYGDRKQVVLLETGMGSMHASIAVYEVAAAVRTKYSQRDLAKRVIKIGTCSGLYKNLPAGSVLVPPCALDNEGATKWNHTLTEAELEQQLLQCVAQPPVLADQVLTQQWANHLWQAYGNWFSDFMGDRYKDRTPIPAVWSIDSFHGVRHRVEKIYPFVRKYEAERLPDVVPVCFENECSSHSSACKYLDLRIAAALVVSWSSDQVQSLASTGEDIRSETDETNVHDVEEQLIVKAVNYLLG